MEEAGFVSTGDRAYLKALVFFVISRKMGLKANEPLRPESEMLTRKLGAFVTLKTRGNLRGCIGSVIGDHPLEDTIRRMAAAAAFEDPRFQPLEARELSDLEIEISVLGPLELVPDPNKVVPGRDGLLVSRHGRSGLLLPQVATEWGWDREQFLSHTCRKASLPAEAWKDPETQIYRFQAEVF
ncbi:MAG: AmmeMemoRadiSam system protein A [Deltaproteobacteria bacterium]|nr:AmmeMemoRadiSam system protein A [Deltaproteobacteria bacterium]